MCCLKYENDYYEEVRAQLPDSKSPKNVEQHNDLPQGPIPPSNLASSLTPICLNLSIKMAKDQNLSLNPTKISGACGRLMCCLKYEND
jgi:cell fate regulator YaaT (PSP1 superfamily)